MRSLVIESSEQHREFNNTELMKMAEFGPIVKTFSQKHPAYYGVYVSDSRKRGGGN